VLAVPNEPATWAQCGAKLPASRTVVHAAAGCGAAHRSEPTGGAA
jgi:hypothetical protein